MHSFFSISSAAFWVLFFHYSDRKFITAAPSRRRRRGPSVARAGDPKAQKEPAATVQRSK